MLPFVAGVGPVAWSCNISLFVVPKHPLEDVFFSFTSKLTKGFRLTPIKIGYMLKRNLFIYFFFYSL